MRSSPSSRTLYTFGSLRAFGSLRTLHSFPTRRSSDLFIRQQRPEGGCDRVGGLTDPRLDTDVARAVILHGIVDRVVGAAVPCLAPYHTRRARGRVHA